MLKSDSRDEWYWLAPFGVYGPDLRQTIYNNCGGNRMGTSGVQGWQECLEHFAARKHSVNQKHTCTWRDVGAGLQHSTSDSISALSLLGTESMNAKASANLLLHAGSTCFDAHHQINRSAVISDHLETLHGQDLSDLSYRSGVRYQRLKFEVMFAVSPPVKHEMSALHCDGGT
jgi:hypothetical protein